MSVPVGKGSGSVAIGPSPGTKNRLQQWSHNSPGATSTPGGTGLGPAHPPKADRAATAKNHAALAAIATKLAWRPMQVVAGKPTHKAPNHVVVPGTIGNGKLGLSNDLPPRSTYNSGDLNV